MESTQVARAIASQEPMIGVTRSHIAAALRGISAFNGETTRTDEQAIAQIASWDKAADEWLKAFIDGGAQRLFTPPPIGEYWVGQGGIYAGQVREEDGTTYHEILSDVKPTGRLNHAEATKWAQSIVADGHADFELPTRRGSALLYANLADLFERTWHWTSTRYGAACAWICNFNDGYQIYYDKSSAGASRAVRRFKV